MPSIDLGVGSTDVQPQETDHDTEPSRRALYHRFAWAYELIIPHPAGPTVDAVAGLFFEHGLRPRAHIVDAGSGAGTYAAGLASHGFVVTAVERSPELVAQARSTTADVSAQLQFICTDFTHGWRPTTPADAVLCRGVLNDVIADAEREAAFEAFASWLRAGGLLLLDVRDRESSLRRYTGGRTFERTVSRGDDVLSFSSTTKMDRDTDHLRVVERWAGRVGGRAVEQVDQFLMRSWTWNSLEAVARKAGFQTVNSLDPAAVGARDDRLVALARR
jgi:glycine/sarcosine N-methyltransferase